MQNGKRHNLPKVNSSALHAAAGRSSRNHTAITCSCIRTLRSVMPLLLAALLSSYITYLIIYTGHLSQHAHQEAAGGSLPHSATGSSSTSSSPTRTTATPATSNAANSQQQEQQQALIVGGYKYAPGNAAFQWVRAAGRRMRVAVVNEAPYHLEIVAGLLQVLQGMPVDVTWYQAGQTTADGTLNPTELVDVTGFTQLLGYLPLMRPSTDTPAPCDFAILVSPEYFENATKVRVGLAGRW